MSLLLDALQRAAKEKEKVADARSGVTTAKADTQPSVAEPFPTISLEPESQASGESPSFELSIEPMALPAESPQKTSAKTLDPIAETRIEPDAVSTMSVTAPEQGPGTVPEPAQPPSLQAEPSSTYDATADTIPAMGQDMQASPQVAAAVEPVAMVEKTPEVPRTVAPVIPPNAESRSAGRNQGSPSQEASPRIAREILAAKPARRSNLRLIALGSAGIVVAALYGAFALGLFDRFFGSAGSSLIPPGAPPAAKGAAVPSQAATIPPAVPASSVGPDAESESRSAEPAIGEKTSSRASAELTPRASSASRKKSARAAPVATAAAESKSISITHSPVSSDLDLAYTALLEGRFDDARVAYRKCLDRNPNERDALLGLAYIAHRHGSNEEAGDLYQRVLRLEPNNPTANAGLVSLGLDGDVARTATRARDLADQTPESAVALATVGAAYVREGRIAEAQQAFFKALALEPENPVHAYNLAVALDRLHKYGAALSYYLRALQLADGSSAASKAGIPLQQARQRVLELQQAATPKPAPQAPSR